jgi:hypothetical protein
MVRRLRLLFSMNVEMSMYVSVVLVLVNVYRA